MTGIGLCRRQPNKSRADAKDDVDIREACRANARWHSRHKSKTPRRYQCHYKSQPAAVRCADFTLLKTVRFCEFLTCARRFGLRRAQASGMMIFLRLPQPMPGSEVRIPRRRNRGLNPFPLWCLFETSTPPAPVLLATEILPVIPDRSFEMVR